MAVLSGSELPDGLHAEAEYQPEHQAYDVRLLGGSQQLLAHTPWLLTPDLSPDRSLVWQDLQSCLQQAGIPVTEHAPKLH
ncbi:hypothetical protein D3C72_2148540 [compost metagenome]